MRVQTVELPRPRDAGAVDAAAARLRAAAAGGTEAVVLSADLPFESLAALVRGARSAGLGHVAVRCSSETPLAASDVAGLLEVGVSRLEIVIERHDPTSLVRLAHAAQSAGASVTVRLPLGRGLATAEQRLTWVLRHAASLTDFELAPSHADPETAEDIAGTLRTAERARATLALASDTPLPPCLVELPADARHLLAPRLREDRSDSPSNDADPACAECALARRCTVSKAELARTNHGRAPRPLADATAYARPGKNPGRRLKVLGAAEVEHFFHVDYDYSASADQAEIGKPTSRIGVIYRCNQVCTFCELADMDVDLAPEKVEAALDSARARGSTRVILTGGEPTLCRDLERYVRYAKALGFEEIELQTNAVLLDRGDLAARLVTAGLTSAQVSLHGPDPAISDRLTAAPGTHARTLGGVSALLCQGARVLLNHLIFKDNCHLLEDFVELCRERFLPFRERLVVQFHSPRNEFPTVAEALAHVPRYAEYADGLRRAVDRARGYGFTVRDLQDPTGIPALCVLGADERYLGAIATQEQRPRYHAWESSWLTRVPACADCALADACMGVPRHYLALYGDGEFRAVPRSA